MDSLKIHLGLPCMTFLRPVGWPPLKWPYIRFRGAPRPSGLSSTLFDTVYLFVRLIMKSTQRIWCTNGGRFREDINTHPDDFLIESGDLQASATECPLQKNRIVCHSIENELLNCSKRLHPDLTDKLKDKSDRSRKRVHQWITPKGRTRGSIR
jgi:hypothetical protein